jgi:hypothetical protein
MIMVLAITVVGYVVAQILQTPINNLVGVADKTLPGDITEATLITIVSAMVLWRLVIRPLRDQTASAQKAVSEREAALKGEAAAQEFRARLHRALEMTSTEAATYAVANRALR